MAECQQRRPIVTSEPGKQRVPGTEQMLQPLSSHAFADVESENHIERDLLEPNEVHFLQDAFVPHLEILWPQASHDLTAILDEHVYAHRIDARRERRLLCTPRHDGRRGDRDGDRGLHCGAFCTAWCRASTMPTRLRA